jgi:hypothetical protein
MSEATHKAALCKVLRFGLPPGIGRVFRHEDAFTGGIPDISISGYGRTKWIEVKLDKPGRRGKVTELQRASIRALDGYFLVFEEHKDGTTSAQLRTDPRCGQGTSEIFGPFKRKSELYAAVAAALLWVVI